MIVFVINYFMDYTHWLVILSAVISIGGASFYIRNTLAGRTKPNLVSWSMWALAPLIGTVAALSAAADFWVTSRIFLAGFLPLLVILASFVNRKSYWRIGLFDFLCGVCSFGAIIAWMITAMPQIAILFAALGDGFAAIPTLRKAWYFPETETGITYVASFISVLLILPSISVWNIENSAFQLYLLIVNALLLSFVYRKRIFSMFFGRKV